MTIVSVSHIILDDKGIAFIEGTGTRVILVVMDKINGLTPEQIHAGYGYLSLSQIHAALAYYYDHQDELDRQIAQEIKEIAAKRRQAIATGQQPSRNALETHGK